MSLTAIRQEEISNKVLSFEDELQAVLLKEWDGQQDSAHDIAHIMRVRGNALNIMQTEGGDIEVIIAAVWLHDLVNLPKDHPDRAKASAFSADKAAQILSESKDFPDDKIKAVQHAVLTHSFSAGIKPETLEAKILQDADRIDALGAIGIARCFAVSGALGRPLLHPSDPLCENRAPDDTKYAVDHFFVKLFKLPETMQTKAGKALAQERTEKMKNFLHDIKSEQCFNFSLAD
jgi:uncharacterized protein